MSALERTMSESKRIAGLLHDVFIGELLSHQPGEAWHGPAVLGLVEDLSAEQAAKKPLPGVHSIWELTLHIANWNEIVVRRLGGEAVEGLINTEQDWPRQADGDEQAWRQTVDRLKRSYESLLAAIAAASDQKLAEKAPNRKFSNYVMLHGIIHHNVYHAGQIAMLRKALAETAKA
jgi:uncharacterized damage-inducible protein DinB